MCTNFINKRTEVTVELKEYYQERFNYKQGKA